MSVEVVKLEQIKGTHPDNPRRVYDQSDLDSLRDSIKQHGVLTPVTLTATDGGFLILAGSRRFAAAKAAGLAEIPAQVIAANGDARVVGVTENVVRSDLSPVEEATAYEALIAEHKTVKKVAKLVNRSETHIADRLRLLALPDATRQLVDEKVVPLSVTPLLGDIAAQDAVLADVVAAQCTTRSQAFLADPAGFVRQVIAQTEEPVFRSWPVADFEYRSLAVVPASVENSFEAEVAYMILKLGVPYGERVGAEWDKLRPIDTTSRDDYAAHQDQRHRQRVWNLSGEQVLDEARAYGCLLEIPAGEGIVDQWGEEVATDNLYLLTDAEWITDRLLERIRVEAEREAPSRRSQTPSTGSGAEGEGVTLEAEAEARKAARDEEYEQRVKARRANLKLGAQLTAWQPSAGLDEVKLLCEVVLQHEATAAAWAMRLCLEQPTTTSKAGKEKVSYPRTEMEKQKLRAAAVQALDRCKTPEDCIGVTLRLLIAQHRVDTKGLLGADRQGVYEPHYLAQSKLLTKVGNAAVKPQKKKEA